MQNVPTREAHVWHIPRAEEERFLPEGPRVTEVTGRQAVTWVNIQTSVDATTGELHAKFLDNGEHRKWALPGRPGFALPTDRDNVMLLGLGKEVGTFDLFSETWTPIATIPDDNPRTIINDGEVEPGGNAVIFGTKDLNFADPLAHLYLFTPKTGEVRVLAGGMVCSNGKVFRHGDLFDIDTPTRKIVRYSLNAAMDALEAKGTAVDLSGVDGFPDGMTDRGDGTVIVAMYNPEPVPAGRALRFDLETGKLLEAFATPGSPRVT